MPPSHLLVPVLFSFIDDDGENGLAAIAWARQGEFLSTHPSERPCCCFVSPRLEENYVHDHIDYCVCACMYIYGRKDEEEQALLSWSSTSTCAWIRNHHHRQHWLLIPFFLPTFSFASPPCVDTQEGKAEPSGFWSRRDFCAWHWRLCMGSEEFRMLLLPADAHNNLMPLLLFCRRGPSNQCRLLCRFM